MRRSACRSSSGGGSQDIGSVTSNEELLGGPPTLAPILMVWRSAPCPPEASVYQRYLDISNLLS